MKRNFRKIGRLIVFFFLQGVLFVVPTAATLYVIFALFTLIDGLLPFDYPGLGLLILVSALTVLGFLANTIIATPVRRYFDRLLEKAPLIKTIYTAFTDLMGAFVGKKRSFNQPVLVKLNRASEIEKPGFITNKELNKLGIEGEKVAVYLPHSYAFSGNLFIVPAENVRMVDVRAADYMKFIVSGGVAKVEKRKPKANT